MNVSYPLKRRGVFALSMGVLAVAVGLFLSLGSTAAWAQTSGTISGQVTDEQSAAIPEAEVIIVDTATGSSQKTATNAAGRYIFSNVAPGVYDVKVTKPGFSQVRMQGQKVSVGLVLTLNVTMRVGAVSQTVEVSATVGAELQTTNAAVGSTLSGDSLVHLPNLGRDVSTLAILQPGITPGGFTAGAYADQNTFTLDGGNNSDDMAGNNTSYVTNFVGVGGTQTNGAPSGVMPTPIESIEEFKVTTFNQTADFNGSIGSEVKLVTKRGTNQFHGSGYGYYYATNVGAANTWVNNHTPSKRDGVSRGYTPLPSNHRSRFGTAIGGPLTPRILGGKTYFFFNYEGSRFPNVATYERPVPSVLMRLGVIQVPDASGKYQAYNLNPRPVTDPTNGVVYQPATCGAAQCDPRGIGLNPIVQQIWQKMPVPNDPIYALNGGDQYNLQGYLSTLRAPLKSNNFVGRVDHDFGDKWRLFATYRFLRLVNLTNNQVDIGGVLPGNTLGQPAAAAPRSQVPSFFVAGLTTNITPTITNSFTYNYTRNFWQWGSANAPPQLAGLGGAVEIANGAAATNAENLNALIPYNVNTQNIRQRFWDGKDHLFKDDVTMIKGNHLIQFGGLYQRNFNYHSRTDNGQGINNQIVYQIASSGINFNSFTYPSAVPTAQQSAFRNLYTEVLGLVNQPQVAYTRAGKDLTLQPVGSSAFDKSIIPTYSLYITDSWHLKPTFTLTLGLSYTLEMPPYEIDGKQVELVGPDGKLIETEQYLATRKQAALAGQVYEPALGFAIMPNVIGKDGKKGIKYPYYPFYGGISPRIAAAWSPGWDSGLLGKVLPRGRTVIRGGYSRIYGRLNGVNLVLVPLLGPGLLQAVSCNGPSRTGQCLGTNNVDPSTVFRIGTDGMTAPLPQASQTLAQPYFSGVGANIPAGDSTVLDPRYRPERTDNFTLSIQREINRKMTLEVGYIGRIIKNEFQEINLDAVPYMTTLGGQTFAQAFGNLYTSICGLGGGACSGTLTPLTALPAQPFIEAALGGANSAYCTGFANCTVALATKQAGLIRQTAVSDLWKAMYSAPSWTLGRTMISAPIPGGSASGQGTSINTTTSLGYGNYNALFVSLRTREFHGFTGTSNFTWGRSLGTGTLGQANSSNTALDIWNMQANYGPQNFDIKMLYNFALYYQPPYFKTQRGILGRLLGGWTFSPLFTAQTGPGTSVTYSEGSCTGCQAFGEVVPPASASATTENAVLAGKFTGGNSAHYNVAGSGGVGTNNPTGVNMFADPATVLKQFRPCVLGVDTSCGGYYVIRRPPQWNLDMAVAKDFSIWKERVGATLHFQFTNLLNHMDPGAPSLSLTGTGPSTFGRITSQVNTPRQMEFGLRIHF